MADYPARAHSDCTPERCLVAEVAGGSERDNCIHDRRCACGCPYSEHTVHRGQCLPHGCDAPSPAPEESTVRDAVAQTRARLEGTTWRYAITRERIDGEDHYTVREVYTAPDGRLSWTEEPIAARGDTWTDCANDIALMTRAMNAPVLDLTLDPPAFVPLLEIRRATRRTDG